MLRCGCPIRYGDLRVHDTAEQCRVEGFRLVASLRHDHHGCKHCHGEWIRGLGSSRMIVEALP